MSSSDFIFDILHKSVEEGEKEGADFVEARYDNLNSLIINYTNDNIKQSGSSKRKGFGIVVYKDGVPGFSFTPEMDFEKIKEAVKRAVNLAKSTEKRSRVKLDFDNLPEVKDILKLNLKKPAQNYDFEYKLDMLKRGISSLKENVDPTTTTSLYGEMNGEKFFVNSEGSEIYWTPNVIEMRWIGVLIENGKQATSMVRKSTSEGLEVYEDDKFTIEIVN